MTHRIVWTFLLFATNVMATPERTTSILATSEGGHRHTALENVRFEERAPGTRAIEIFPDQPRHRVHGIGTSITESSAFVLAHLDPETRRDVMQRIWGAEGANFSITRTHIGSCDFTVEGKYSYTPVPDLDSFTIAPDLEGFDPARYPGVVDPSYDLLPMIREAMAIKRAQGEDLKIMASAWTAPDWMKDIETWFIPSTEENDWKGTGGRLKPEYVPAYAEYLVRYLEAYREVGVPIWAITPVNEPDGNSGMWESMHFTPETQNAFVNEALGPLLHARGFGTTRLYVYDQNRDHLKKWTDTILGDPRSRDHVTGVAVHWYSSTYEVYEEELEAVRAKFPDFEILQTEGCIDDLGKKAGGGIRDPEGFEEEGWFGDDAWWWNRNATDWAYTAEWWPTAEKDHPIYVPVHRYARDMIAGLNHGLSGWIDWNVVLDRDGGPNHVGNFCGAPIMIDTTTKQIYETPLFHVMSQLSRSIRPGDQVLATARTLDGDDEDALHACATRADDGRVSVQLLNTTKASMTLDLVVGPRAAAIAMPANSVVTVQFAP